MKKSSNKGFSLVELIIVIAIMVILVAVIAPQYLKYVHNSRISTDVQTAADMQTAIATAIADGEEPFNAAGTAIDCSKVDNLDGMPKSKLTKDTTSWKVTGDNVKGVTKIILTYKSVDYECYPDPDNSTDGINAKLKK